MTICEIRNVLLWCVGLNYAVMIIWFGAFVFAHDRIYEMHKRWFNLSVTTFDTIHYTGLAVYKIGVLLFFLVPLIAILVVL